MVQAIFRGVGVWKNVMGSPTSSLYATTFTISVNSSQFSPKEPIIKGQPWGGVYNVLQLWTAGKPLKACCGSSEPAQRGWHCLRACTPTPGSQLDLHSTHHTAFVGGKRVSKIQSIDAIMLRRLQRVACTSTWAAPQRAQYGFIKEYTLNHFGGPHVI